MEHDWKRPRTRIGKRIGNGLGRDWEDCRTMENDMRKDWRWIANPNPFPVPFRTLFQPFSNTFFNPFPIPFGYFSNLWLFDILLQTIPTPSNPATSKSPALGDWHGFYSAPTFVSCWTRSPGMHINTALQTHAHNKRKMKNDAN